MRKILMVILILLLCLGFMPVTAQSEPDVCGDLSISDCDALLTSQDTMTDIRSLVFASESNLSMLSADERDRVALRVAVDGHYHFHLDDVPPATNITEWLSGIMTTLKLEMNITIEDEGDTLSDLGMDFPFELEFRIVDGFIYVNIQAFNESDEASWAGLDLTELVILALEQSELPATTPIPAIEGDGTGFLGMLVALGGEMSRLDDQGGLWVFKETVNGEQILADEETKTSIIFGLYQGFQQQAALLGNIDNDELLDMTAAYVELIPYMTLHSQRMIDPATGYLHQITFTLDYSPDANAVHDLLDDVSDPMGLEVLLDAQVDLSFGLNMKRFDDAPTVIAPDNPLIIPFSLIETLLPSGSEM